MRNRNRLLGAIGALLLTLPASAFAQGSSLSAFSPYTFYGLGDFSVQGPAFLRSMGGIGVAYANGRRMNYLNPASYSAVNPRLGAVQCRWRDVQYLCEDGRFEDQL
ncbi:MAG: hypothetical protein ACLR8Y_06180 [Alistipes indistinctus]